MNVFEEDLSITCSSHSVDDLQWVTFSGLDQVRQQLEAPAEVLWISCGQEARDKEETEITYLYN